MKLIDQVDVDQLADGAPIDSVDMEAILASTADFRIRRPARAWLESYRLARWLGCRESTALLQAGAAWDRAANLLEEDRDAKR